MISKLTPSPPRRRVRRSSSQAARILTVLAGLAWCAGCASTMYYVDGPEARRALTQIQRQDDEVVVTATEEQGSGQVEILLRGDDEVLPLVSDAVAASWGDPDERVDLMALAPRSGDLRGFSYRHRNPGQGLLPWGLLLMCVGTGMTTQMAIALGEPAYLLPVAGPFIFGDHAMAALESSEAGLGAAFTGLASIFLTMITATFHVTGATLLILSAVTWRQSPEVRATAAFTAATPRPMRFGVALAPMPGGGASLGVAGRF